MEQTILAVVNKLDSNSIILVLFGFGVWKFAVGAMEKFNAHGDKMTDSLDSIAKDTTQLRVDMSIIAARVELHEDRLDRLESK